MVLFIVTINALFLAARMTGLDSVLCLAGRFVGECRKALHGVPRFAVRTDRVSG